MTFMAWNAALETGIPAIDAQHQWLVNTTNQLHDHISTGSASRAELGEVLEGLVDYTMNHFIEEEMLFEQYGYPDAAAHKAMHDKLSATTMQVLHQFEAGGEVGMDVLEFLKDWLLNHIMKADMAYAPFLKAHGAA